VSYQPQWDIDLKHGLYGESIVKDVLLLGDGEIEVKTDRKARSTGNLYIETHCRRRDGWHPSGISTSEASVWFFIIGPEDKLMVGISAAALRREAVRFAARVAEETDGSHPTRGVLVPLAALVREPFKQRAS
jgi:hypothetical protein